MTYQLTERDRPERLSTEHQVEQRVPPKFNCYAHTPRQMCPWHGFTHANMNYTADRCNGVRRVRWSGMIWRWHLDDAAVARNQSTLNGMQSTKTSTGLTKRYAIWIFFQLGCQRLRVPPPATIRGHRNTATVCGTNTTPKRLARYRVLIYQTEVARFDSTRTR